MAVDDIHGKRRIIVKTTYSGRADFRILVNGENDSRIRITKDGKDKKEGAVRKLAEGAYPWFEADLKPGENVFDLTLKTQCGRKAF